MNVYPVNALETANIVSPQKEPYSNLKGLYNRYMAYTVDFNVQAIELAGAWNLAVETDSVILGNTNAHSGRIRLYNDNELLHDIDFSINGFLTIISIAKTAVTNFILDLSGNENISLGYIFIGEKWELPRFVVQPAKGLVLRNESDRTFTGQVMGTPKEALRTFSASYMRIPNEQKKAFDDYVNGVQTVIPHVIDPYPEAHEQFEPFFATVNGYGEAVKREENGFYWNFECNWQEAM
ncbi:MAG: hypothetical protein LBQ93_03760 [Treponema sp.]|jgi:hypothetical protein|nr:hypothetical protein [Treponema sp.]